MSLVSNQSKKLELIQWISTVEDASILDRILEIRENEKSDFWDNLSDLEKESIEKGLDDAKHGRLKSHSKAREIYGKWL